MGFKIWVIAYNDYVLDYLWHAKEDVAKDCGPQALDPKWREIINNLTQQVVLQLLENLEDSDKDHMAWIDNLFSSERLFATLRDLRISAAGTVRITKTAREEKIEKKETRDTML